MIREETRLPSKGEAIYQRLRADVLAGRLEPGRRLRYTELCGRYETSMAVLRESMLRLTEQGLVRAEPQLGFQVVSLSPTDLRELTDARIEIETLVLRRAIAEGDVSWEARAIAAHHELARAPKLAKDDPQRLSDKWAHAHSAFHPALLDGCANRRLKAIANALRDSAELTRRWSIPPNQEEGRDTAAEHAAILDATISRDAALAVTLLTEHIQRTTDILLAAVGEDPGTDHAAGK